MEKKKNNIIIIIYLILLLILCTFTIYKIIKNHESKLYNVLYSKIEYNAKKCYLDKKCKDTITLNDLYEKKYLDILYDPISKEELNKDIKIKYIDNRVIIDK